MTQQTTLSIEGMTCSSCSARVQRALAMVAGVGTVMVDARAGAAIINYDPTQTTATALARAVLAAGYPATELRGPRPCCAG